MNFISTKDGEYLAVETIAKITDVVWTVAKDPSSSRTSNIVDFRVETKRGHIYKMSTLSGTDFNGLIGTHSMIGGL